MSTPPESAPDESPAAVQYLRPLRDIVALVLLGAAAMLIFVAVLRLIPSADDYQSIRGAEQSFYGFVNLATIGLPLLAVLLATLIRPEHPKAKLITTVALIEYAVMAFFGVLFGFLIGLVGLVGSSVRAAFEEFLVRGAWLAVFGVVAFAVFQLWRNVYNPPRPAPAPGLYGQPSNPQFGPIPGAGPYGPAQPHHGGTQQFDQTGQPYEQAGPAYEQPGQPYDQGARQAYDQPSWNPAGPTGGPGGPAAPHSGPAAPYGGSPAQPPGPFAPEPGFSQGAAPYSSSSYGSPGYNPPQYDAPGSGARGVTYGSPSYGPPGYGPAGEYGNPEAAPPGDHEHTQMLNPDRQPPDDPEQYRR
ncbi:MAG TPA: hypothetical protein VFO77_10090 [Actinoplanes sp.]|nr:hypothetical protein [Actinoplanes sp.]